MTTRYKVRDAIDGYQIGDTLAGVDVVLATDYDAVVQAGRLLAEMLLKNCDVLNERLIQKHNIAVPFPITESDDYKLAQAFLETYQEAP